MIHASAPSLGADHPQSPAALATKLPSTPVLVILGFSDVHFMVTISPEVGLQAVAPLFIPKVGVLYARKVGAVVAGMANPDE